MKEERIKKLSGRGQKNEVKNGVGEENWIIFSFFLPFIYVATKMIIVSIIQRQKLFYLKMFKWWWNARTVLKTQMGKKREREKKLLSITESIFYTEWWAFKQQKTLINKVPCE